MTDNEIIKGLECCNKEEPCGECPLFKTSYPLCVLNLNAEAYNLINRQKAEIEGWKEAFNNLDKIARPSVKTVKDEKAKAIKEFAEKLKESAFDVDVSFGYGKECYDKAVAVIEIDNLAKERVGETDEMQNTEAD